MIQTVILLVVTLGVVPYVTYMYDDGLKPLQAQMLADCLSMMVKTALGCFVLGQWTGNVSQVDKLWSLIPAFYAGYVTYMGGMNERCILMSILVCLWAARLTFNFARKGGYSWKFWSGEEDYRWSVLRSRPELNSPFRWFLFNLFFICLYQHAVIFLFTSPIILAVESDVPLGWKDYVVATIFLGLLTLETVADEQQWAFQTEKYRRINAKEPLTGEYKIGFIRTGIWSRSRHPNYFAEQSIWVTFYLFSIVASGKFFNWSIAGCLLLLILFKESSNFSEEISAKKYADYKEYQKKTPRFLPL